MENWFIPNEASLPPEASSVLALAPHPDDEIFGCGGVLALYRQRGTPVHVHILTDGAGYAAESARQGIFQTRLAETAAALALLDIAPPSHAEFPDRGLSGYANLAEHVASIMRQHRADLVLAPSLWEIHPDHLALARAVLAAAMHGHRTPPPAILFYEIGAPQRPNLLVDITALWPAKRAAMQCFASQLAHQDYVAHLTALNRYRTYTLPPAVEYAEALTLVTAEQLVVMADAADGDPAGRIMSRWIETALAAADAQAEGLHGRLAAAAAQAEGLHGRLAAAAAQAEWLQAELAAMRNSSSWRLTAPLRWLASKTFRRG